MAGNLLRKHKEPRNQSGSDQGHPQKTQPVLSQEEPYRPFAIRIHQATRQDPLWSEGSVNGSRGKLTLAVMSVSVAIRIQLGSRTRLGIPWMVAGSQRI